MSKRGLYTVDTEGRILEERDLPANVREINGPDGPVSIVDVAKDVEDIKKVQRQKNPNRAPARPQGWQRARGGQQNGCRA